MHTKNRWSQYALTAGLVLSFGLFLMVGCAQETATKRAETPAAQEPAATQKVPTSTPSKPAPQAQVSSLEAHREGTLEKSAGAGPLRDVNFDFDRYDLTPDARETLKGHATWLKANPQVTVEIEGHCDDRGTNEYNLALGARRAESAKRYLMDLGIAANRLSTISYGEELPMCKEQSEPCWAKNRRAHFIAKGAPTT
jgi:peptidoglycan-associated lipoprotein